MNCPCGSGRDGEACCLPIVRGEIPAATPEALMRSRFTAFSIGDRDHLARTYHPSRRPIGLAEELEENIDGTEWIGLRVLSCRSDGDRGEVEFVAYFVEKPVGQVHERSRFVREDGAWTYLDGTFLPAIPLERNEPCPCGSGRKVKKCHA